MSEEKVLTREIAEQFLDSPTAIDLSTFGRLTNGAAKMLAESEFGQELGEFLDLSGIQSITFNQAKALVAFEGDINLDGLTEIEFKVAKQFVKHNHDLSLLGLKNIPKAVANQLRRKQPNIWLNDKQLVGKGQASEKRTPTPKKQMPRWGAIIDIYDSQIILIVASSVTELRTSIKRVFESDLKVPTVSHEAAARRSLRELKIVSAETSKLPCSRKLKKNIRKLRETYSRMLVKVVFDQRAGKVTRLTPHPLEHRISVDGRNAIKDVIGTSRRLDFKQTVNNSRGGPTSNKLTSQKSRRLNSNSGFVHKPVGGPKK